MNPKIAVLSLIVMVSCFVSAKYDERNGFMAAVISGLAYGGAKRILNRDCHKATKLIEEAGIKPIYAKDNTELFNPITMVILENQSKKEIITAFSGTSNIVELIDEVLKSFPVPYDIHPAENSKVLEYFYNHYVNDFRNDLLQKMKEYTKMYEGYSFVFTGHSLGGALAVHAASDTLLSNVFDDSTKVYIYDLGQPRVGNKEFIDQFASKLDGFYRLVHFHDIVPHIPPCITDFKGE